MGSYGVTTARGGHMIRPALLLLISLRSALGAGGSALLIGLSNDNKIGGSTSWEMLIICMSVGAGVIIAGALAHYFWTRHKKKKTAQAKEQQRLEKARQADVVGGAQVTPLAPSPPPAYNSSLEDE